MHTFCFEIIVPAFSSSASYTFSKDVIIVFLFGFVLTKLIAASILEACFPQQIAVPQCILLIDSL